jgi:hypothetical protein
MKHHGMYPLLDIDWDNVLVPPVTLQTAEVGNRILNKWHTPHIEMEPRWLIKKEASEYQGRSNPMVISHEMEEKSCGNSSVTRQTRKRQELGVFLSRFISTLPMFSDI